MKSPSGSDGSSGASSAASSGDSAAASSVETSSGVSADSAATSSASVVAAVSTDSASLTASSWSSGDSDTITLSLVRGLLPAVCGTRSAELLQDQPREQVVETEHDRDDDDHEDQRDGRVGDELVARRPDDLAKLGAHLAVEQDGRSPLLAGLPLVLGRGVAARLSRHRCRRIPSSVVSQTPLWACASLRPRSSCIRKPHSAGQEGLEPPTTGFGDRDSGQLSYCPSQKHRFMACESHRRRH